MYAGCVIRPTRDTVSIGLSRALISIGEACTPFLRLDFRRGVIEVILASSSIFTSMARKRVAISLMLLTSEVVASGGHVRVMSRRHLARLLRELKREVLVVRLKKCKINVIGKRATHVLPGPELILSPLWIRVTRDQDTLELQFASPVTSLNIRTTPVFSVLGDIVLSTGANVRPRVVTEFRRLLDALKEPGLRLRATRIEDVLACIMSSLLARCSREGLNAPDLPVVSEKLKGDFLIGEQLRMGEPVGPFYLSMEDISRHIAILGSTGSGKSSLVKVLLDEVLSHADSDLRVWIFDFHGEYYDLACKFSDEFYVLIPASTEIPLALNIFQPRENPENYAHFLHRLLSEILRSSEMVLSPQMERVLGLAVRETVLDRGNPIHFVYNLWKYSNIVDTSTSRMTFTALINRLRNVFTGLAGRVFWVLRSNIEVTDLVRRNVLFDLSLMSRGGVFKGDILILVNVILRYAFTELMRQRNRKLLVVVEEARYVLPWRARTSSADTLPSEDLITLSRKYGLFLVVVAQSPNVVSQDVLSNAGTLFLFHTPDATDLLQRDLTQVLSLLPPRECLVRLTSTPAVVHVRVREWRASEDASTLLSLVERSRRSLSLIHI